MKKVLILAEGQTEETFIREALTAYLARKEIYPTPTLITTKRVTESGSVFKGGIVPYERLKRDLNRLLNDSSAAIVTTMIDFYGLPGSFPGRKTMPPGSCYERVAYLEEKLRKDVNHHRFLPYLALHEFEAMLFVKPEQINQAFPDIDRSKELSAIRAQFGSPEEIDDNPLTAPSKRLAALFPEYRKALHGPLAILEIGIDQIRNECAHFNDWIKKLESLAES